MDLQLPDGTGVDACREILSRWPDTTVLILTSFADDQALYSAKDAGRDCVRLAGKNGIAENAR